MAWLGACCRHRAGTCAGNLVKADGRQSVEQPEQKWLRTRTADEEEEEEEEDEEEA